MSRRRKEYLAYSSFHFVRWCRRLPPTSCAYFEYSFRILRRHLTVVELSEMAYEIVKLANQYLKSTYFSSFQRHNRIIRFSAQEAQRSHSFVLFFLFLCGDVDCLSLFSPEYATVRTHTHVVSKTQQWPFCFQPFCSYMIYDSS